MNPECHDCDNEDWCILAWHHFLKYGYPNPEKIHCPHFPQKDVTVDGIR